ncbi:MAG: dihydrofolate reductase [Saprospiraceae bacterium]|nr:dihydrofolate reductase [Saprospiraceae bacterium]
MKRILLLIAMGLFVLAACKRADKDTGTETVEVQDDFNWNPENFSDKRILRYQVPGFEQLTLEQKKLVYYLVQAGLAGRDIIWDQNYRHNLAVRKALEAVIKNHQGDRETADWQQLLEYAKNVFFSNGIHHHYSNDKFIPGFSREYFDGLLKAAGHSLPEEVLAVIFDPAIDAKKINQDPNVDVIAASAVNFYGPGITQKEVEAYYNKLAAAAGENPISFGLNSRLVKGADGKLSEQVWHAGGLYGAAIQEVIKWLELAVGVAENEPQANALKLLVEYYQTGDLRKWDEYNIAWVKATDGDIDYINGFVEVYNDPLGYRGTFENIVQINDFEMSDRMKVLSQNAQWFEDNAPILPQHKKSSVAGISYRVVNVAGEAGDASPSTPIGVNLPNADWIRKTHGSKSVSLGNIEHAYDQAGSAGMLAEFAHDEEEIERSKKYGSLAGKVHTALHEVLGHASGQLEAGVNTSVIGAYYSPLEEARADLFALWYIMDPKLIELGVVPDLEVAKAEYDQYLKNGYMLQLRRIEPGKTITQAHMRNRQMVSKWVLEKGAQNGTVAIVQRDGKSFIDIKDYDKLRLLFGDLLKEVQRIKSQGDAKAAQKLFETYGVQVDPAIHQEVLDRSATLNIPPYAGFINPRLTPVTNSEGQITDIQLEYPADFIQQMLEYGERYAFLPIQN